MKPVLFPNIRGLFVLTIACSLLLMGCEREPRALAGYDAPSIEERYGLGAHSEMDATIVPVTLSDGRRAQLVIPKNRSSQSQVYFRENGELYPVALQNAGLTREEFVRSEPRIVERRVVERAPARTVETKKKRSLEKEILIVAGSSGAGAAIGAVAGGKKGAAVGALSGGIAGLIYDLSTRNK